ncbi:asparagine synthase (glutamine-hydrolyzing) [Bradyrhizobium barranii subsp. barranii]|uniref:asparagine synthase (glutamine-hydrolyzing) n=1 Tax=Bradyrhizobium barranii subsp. barranii TaxID=2823807 RepID=A0A7Z0QBG7_9BRAD|nr:asparagine synthase (glutamine-hydrolyzing) [Bradyrhizobium barranii]UGX92633.1 asparagine synthase (glutamine-hydrolyzing) [Bradyrhizobium barranii subsp. barranii]
MCGICGFIGQVTDKSVTERNLARCAQTLAHRGPDASGSCVTTSFAFAHRRLAIIDPDPRSNQPFLDEEHGLAVTYNGEIYNYRDLRQELLRRGYQFRTETDTEVLCKAFACWGIDSVKRLRGMFAFAIYDQNTGTAFLVRDRLGIKPLYYACADDDFVFASQPSAILQWPGVRSKVDPAGLSSFLSYRAVFGERTLFADIRKLQPGTWLKITPQSHEHRRWWDPACLDDSGDGSSLETLIGSAVEEHLLPHTPVAALLSGGLDSSVLAFELSRHSSQKPTCFTGIVSNDAYDESPYAVEVAKSLKLAHVLVRLPGATSLDVVKRLTAVRGHPIGMHNEAAMYLLARAVSHSHKVLLTGEGADEIFLGYSRIFRLSFDLRRQALLAALPDVIGRPARRHLGLPKFKASEFELFLARYSYFPQAEKLGLATSAWRKDIVHDAELIDWMNNAFHSGGPTPVERIRQFFVRHHLPALLEMVDNTTMAAGVESRVPFTDHRIVALALRMSFSEHLRWKHAFAPFQAAFTPIEKFSETLDVSKAALRTLYSDRLPASVITRRKLGFPLPLGKWATDQSSAPFRDLIFKESPAIADYLDIGAVRRWYARRSQVANDTFGKQLWLICNLEVFLRQLST